MEPPAKQQESESPGVRESESSEHKRPAAPGAPATYAAYAWRKDVSVRVSVTALRVAEAEELREEGYGHGV